MHWTVTLKAIVRFDRDIKLECYKLKYVKAKRSMDVLDKLREDDKK